MEELKGLKIEAFEIRRRLDVIDRERMGLINKYNELFIKINKKEEEIKEIEKEEIVESK